MCAREGRRVLGRIAGLASSKGFSTHEREILRAVDALQGQVHIELGPAKVIRGRSLDEGQLSDGGVPEPRELGEGEVSLPPVHGEPDPEPRYVRQFNA
jgi:hypothetical protein